MRSIKQITEELYPMALIERLCKAKNPELFKDTPLDEFTVFTALRDSASPREKTKGGAQ